MNNNMIDNLMGQVEHDQRPDEGLQGPRRKNLNSFGDIINKMRWDAHELKIIVEKDIPRAFPFTEPVGGSEPGYRHTQYEYLGSGFLTEIKDGYFAMDTVRKILSKLDGLQFILSSLFPNTIDNGAFEVQVADGFQMAKQAVDDAITDVKRILSELKRGLSQNPVDAINKKEMEKMDKHIIRIGKEYIKSKGKIPKQLVSKANIDTRPEVIAREMVKLEAKNSLPRMDQVLADSGSPPPILAFPNLDLGVSIFRKLKNDNYR